MLVVAGVAPDLDYTSYFAGAGTFLRLDRGLLHSLPSLIVLSGVIASAFQFLDRKRSPKNPSERLRLGPAVATCAIGLAGHLLLDLCTATGVQLLWPFRARWFAAEIAPTFDPWLLILLAAGILLPGLFRLVSEEIGDRKKGAGPQRGAIVMLALLGAFLGGRAVLHSRAVSLLLSREYHSQAALEAGAFPISSSPFQWRGLVATDNSIEELEVSVAPGSEFDSERSLTRYKPESSPALEAGERTVLAKEFLAYARFPVASVIRHEDGNRFELHDLRFASGDTSPANIFLRIDFDSSLQPQREDFRFASSGRP
jgi:inner membrane protein